MRKPKYYLYDCDYGYYGYFYTIKDAIEELLLNNESIIKSYPYKKDDLGVRYIDTKYRLYALVPRNSLKEYLKKC